MGTTVNKVEKVEEQFEDKEIRFLMKWVGPSQEDEKDGFYALCGYMKLAKELEKIPSSTEVGQLCGLSEQTVNRSIKKYIRNSFKEERSHLLVESFLDCPRQDVLIVALAALYVLTSNGTEDPERIFAKHFLWEQMTPFSIKKLTEFNGLVILSEYLTLSLMGNGGALEPRLFIRQRYGCDLKTKRDNLAEALKVLWRKRSTKTGEKYNIKLDILYEEAKTELAKIRGEDGDYRIIAFFPQSY